MGKAAAKKVVLTDRALKALKPAPAGKRYWVWDAATPNLGVRVTDKGHRSFVVVRRRPGDEQPFTHVIGSYPAVSLADARKEAPDALSAIVAGRTPEEMERERLRIEARNRKDTFVSVAEDFITKHVAGLRQSKEVENLIRRELIERWGPRPVTEIDRRDVIDALDEIIARGAPYAARHTFAVARKLFNWALHRDTYGLEHSPCARLRTVDAVGRAVSRDRVLTDDELKLVWRAAEKDAYPFGSFVQMLMLTGQRLHEIADARWSEIDGKRLIVPVERMKMKRTHTVPLTPRVAKLLEGVPRFKDRDGYVFTTTGGKRPISGFSKAKARLDRNIAAALKDAGVKRGVPHFTFHDLRRTVRTRLSSLGVLPVIAELVIGHTQKGIHAVYDRYTYDDEKRAALLKWETLLLSIVEPPKGERRSGANVVPMRKRARA
jgi:integrase